MKYIVYNCRFGINFNFSIKRFLHFVIIENETKVKTNLICCNREIVDRMLTSGIVTCAKEQKNSGKFCMTLVSELF